MTKEEERNLLLRDLCARLPYGVKILHEGWNFEWDDELSTVERVVGIDNKFIYTKVIDSHNGEEYRDDKWPVDTFDDKLFLRPMSSMTEEEFDKYEELEWSGDFEHLSLPLLDWLNKNMFDYRGLIEKGLAIAVTKDNNPYKE